VAPVETIGGSNALLCGDAPDGIAVDSINGDIYVANYPAGSGCSASVNVYASGANGNVAPIAVIQGANTKLVYPFGVALDPSGNIYVSDSHNDVFV
jgi:DNA-binding beta-propeller fold protein YncE